MKWQNNTPAQTDGPRNPETQDNPEDRAKNPGIQEDKRWEKLPEIEGAISTPETGEQTKILGNPEWAPKEIKAVDRSCWTFDDGLFDEQTYQFRDSLLATKDMAQRAVVNRPCLVVFVVNTTSLTKATL